MDGRTSLILLIVAIVSVLAAGCTGLAPGGTQGTTVSTTIVTTGLPTPDVTQTALTPGELTNVSANITGGVTPVPVTTRRLKQHNCPLLSLPPVFLQKPQSRRPLLARSTTRIWLFSWTVRGMHSSISKISGTLSSNLTKSSSVRITADHPILAYVIRTYDTPLLRTIDGVPTYNKYDRTYDYGRLLPIMKLENIYEGGSEFTVKDLGKYTLVLDTRLSSMDYRFVNEVTTVSVRILKVG